MSTVRLDIEPEKDHVAVLHHIVLAFRAHQALFLAVVMEPPQASQISEGDHLRPDEPPLEVGVDLAGGLGGPWCPGEWSRPGTRPPRR